MKQVLKNGIGKMTQKHVAFLLPDLSGGGAERVVINLLRQMATNPLLQIDLVLSKAKGPYLSGVPKQVNVVELHSSRQIASLYPLTRYLNKDKPDYLVSHLSHVNVIALLAKQFANVSIKVIVVEHNTFSKSDPDTNIKGKVLRCFMRRLYPHACQVIAVSNGSARDLELELKLPADSVKTIYNPIVDDLLFCQASQAVEHLWFIEHSIPIIISAGRLTKQKDFVTLIKAFRLLRLEKPAKLVILGEGELRGQLEALVKEYNLTKDVWMPGFVANPLAFISKADVFVMSSQWEGFGNVLVEALACGCPVVATDCQHGPREILSDGQYGILTPVDDFKGLAEAIYKSLNIFTDKNRLIKRANDFTIEIATQKYLQLFDK
jgi:glycosyltransferase involved in cell wall biosynthesis